MQPGVDGAEPGASRRDPDASGRRGRVGFPLSIAAIVLVLLTVAGTGLKLYYSGAPNDEPRWLLAATAGVFSVASGISFRFAEGQGYLSADGRLLLYRGCSGLNFLVLTGFLAGLLPLALRLESRAGEFAGAGSAAQVGRVPWRGLILYYLVAGAAVAGFTLLANSGRMLALLALAATVSPEVLHPGAAHLSAGSFVYLVFLVLFYLTLRLTLQSVALRS